MSSSEPPNPANIITVGSMRLNSNVTSETQMRRIGNAGPEAETRTSASDSFVHAGGFKRVTETLGMGSSLFAPMNGCCIRELWGVWCVFVDRIGNFLGVDRREHGSSGVGPVGGLVDLVC